jgi:Uma2 family endonuclease
MSSAARRLATYEEYEERERVTGLKHEYVGGVIYAMAGGTTAHADVMFGFLTRLHRALEGKPCRVSNSEQRLRIPALDATYYPDGAVYCGERIPDVKDPNGLVNPTVLVEVLSGSSEAYDRGDKFDDYRRIESFREYVLVSSRSRRIDVLRRQGDESWNLETYLAGGMVRLQSIDVALPLDAIYEGIELDRTGARGGVV